MVAVVRAKTSVLFSTTNAGTSNTNSSNVGDNRKEERRSTNALLLVKIPTLIMALFLCDVKEEEEEEEEEAHL